MEDEYKALAAEEPASRALDPATSGAAQADYRGAETEGPAGLVYVNETTAAQVDQFDYDRRYNREAALKFAIDVHGQGDPRMVLNTARIFARFIMGEENESGE